ncbi:SMP-30/gluconolactonase/LRE family protein [Modestobacter sp. VKM Ac-2986]|uniref:SMP-30/gluconolactonase/LRE family protein n=1 Tax=Modestobacter sp. VKM Ac-2986 TaxID=3004140 RepID=UPI0022AB891B|nr:SMP-30/gluconolactonase/LRE family protein [Modestobacter sp. VKM Ac-2986]MCZ2830149.1 SMP-30/gluconolactonase/LRE family protein [Modestobacter sp. VKM Ac-2986]
MIRLTATPASASPAEHGEGPIWDAARSELVWVDITQGQVRRGRVSGDDVLDLASHRGGDTVGFVVPAAAGGWLLGAGAGVSRLSEDGEAHVLIELTDEGGSEETGGTRMNDGACDRAGRFFGGTMAFDERPGGGTLYRLDLDGTVRTVLDGLTVSNGIGWSPDDRTMYLSDSGQTSVWAFDYDLDSGAMTDRRVLLDFSEDPDGVADGLTVDDEGCLWTALWGGAQVRRYSPTGELLTVVDVDAQNTTSCAFSGDLLVISTSVHGMSDEARAAQPDAGKLFTVRTGVTGPGARPYRGPLGALSQL